MYQIWKLRSLIADWNDFVLTHYPIVKETRIYLTKSSRIGVKISKSLPASKHLHPCWIPFCFSKVSPVVTILVSSPQQFQ